MTRWGLVLAVWAAAWRAAAAAPTDAVFEHHADPARSGHYIVPELTFEAARRLRLDARFQAPIDGPVYAQPLYWPARGSHPALLLIATAQNRIVALDAETGAVVWQRSVGTPVPRTLMRCGNIDPLGITGTPIIDPKRATLYLDALVRVPAGEPRHLIYALALEDGAVRPGWPIDVAAALAALGESFDARVQSERGALALLEDTLYVPFGGYFGDCGDYRGRVVGISLSDDRRVRTWATRGRGGGIWAPGGIASDGQSLFLATGNTFEAREWAGGEAIVRLRPDLSFSAQNRDFFAPSDWRALDGADADLGGSNPLIVRLTGKPGALILALGKDAKAYVLDADNLGGVGGARLTASVAATRILSAPAYYASGAAAFIAFQGRGRACPRGAPGDLVMLRLQTAPSPALETLWCAPGTGRGEPIITTTDGTANPIVWIADAEGDNRLRGFRADTGALLFAGGQPLSSIEHFQTPIAIGRRLYVAAEQRVYSFVF